MLIRYLLAAAVLAALLPSNATGAEFTLQPTLTLRGEVNDNIFLSRDDPRTEYIVQAIPDVVLHYATPLWVWDVDYSLDYRHFERRQVDDDIANTLTLRSRTDVVKNLFFVAVNDDLARVSLDVNRDYTVQSPVVNQAERNIFTVNPYFLFRPTDRTNLTIGYSYIQTEYSGNAGINRIDSISYVETLTQLSSRLTLTTGVRYRMNSNVVQDFNAIDVYAGPRFEYVPRCYLYFTAGNTWFEAGEPKETSQTFFDVGIVHRYSTNNRLSQPYWDAGLIHRFSTVTVSLETSLLFVEAPGSVLTREDLYMATVSKETTRTFASITGAIREYKDLDLHELLSRSEEAQATFRYRITERMTGTVFSSFQHLDDRTVGSFTETVLSTMRLEYLLRQNTTLAFEYRYLNSFSPGVDLNNYQNIRQILELIMRF